MPPSQLTLGIIKPSVTASQASVQGARRVFTRSLPCVAIN